MATNTVPSLIPLSTSIRSRRSIDNFSFLNPKHFNFDCIYPDCPQKFTLTNDLYYHIRDHNKELLCPRCDNKFKCMASLVYHVRTHTGAKPYVCPLPDCQFVTATKGNLKAHLLSNQHKDLMSLDLLNVILSLDTLHARLEVSLHAPRERKKRRVSPNQAQHFDFSPPARKKSRSSISNKSSSGALSSLGTNELIQLQPIVNFPRLFAPPPIFAPMKPTFNTASYYKNDNDINMEPRSTTDSLTQKWDDCNFIQTPLSVPEDVEEDLTVRIKLTLLESIKKAEHFTDINQLNDADTFLMSLDGTDSTNHFYGGKFSDSKFLHNGRSNSPGLMFKDLTQGSSEEPKCDPDLELCIPPVTF
eukprot:117791_1